MVFEYFIFLFIISLNIANLTWPKNAAYFFFCEWDKSRLTSWRNFQIFIQTLSTSLNGFRIEQKEANGGYKKFRLRARLMF